MKTVSELNHDILKTIMKIRDNYPELAKFLAELPVTIPDESNPKINVEILQDYYESLNRIVTEYDDTHNNID